MKIISDFNKDVRSPHKVPGSYEWWYFDAVSENGLSIVVIFYDGNPFSRRYIESLKNGKMLPPSDFPAITISVYKKGVPLFYSFEEMKPEQGVFSDEEPHGRVGKNIFLLNQQGGNSRSYLLQLDQELPCGDHLTATLELAFHPEVSLHGQLNDRADGGSHEIEEDLSEFNDYPSEIEEGSSGFNDYAHKLEKGSVGVDKEFSGHEWNLVVPRGDVSGSLNLNGTVYDFRGTGYHDHNTGVEPLKESFNEWYWGRYHMEEETLIYYLMLGESGWENRAWILKRDGTLLTDRITCHLEDLEYNLFGLHSARKIVFKSEAGEWLVQKSNRIDNGPFYQRFEGRLLGNHRGKLIRGHGFSEYIKPSRIYTRLFWPLVNMRINYPGEPHWVQKNRRLYRWTWQYP